ncbi:MAG: nicotinate phosphoribosyltransferase [Candidatus Omnitrophica bacterium]|nr:nicotinate phosphoribosyltransferase [Candidatus Omnitrophota bacterium]
MNSGLVLDLYQLTMAQVYFKYKRTAVATFDLFIRSSNRPFYVACGIDDALLYLQNFQFTSTDIDYLKTLEIFSPDFLEYLKTFKFKGTIVGVEEPEIIFASEPILRVTANLIEAQIVESILLNKINLATTLATKAARVILAAQGKAVYDFSLRRTQGIEASLAAAKYSYMVGATGTSNVYAAKLYNIPAVGTMAHSYVMSFEQEIESFIAFAKTFGKKTILLVDTYDTKVGIKNALRVAKYLKKKGQELLGIRLDSGDLVENAKYARYLFDREGLVDVLIVASGNLDEYKILDMTKKLAPIDAFGVGTNMGCSSDLPFTDVIYKLVEIKKDNKDFIPTMKLSTAKSTLPYRKQVYRKFQNEVMLEDIIALENEEIKGEKLLKNLMRESVVLVKEKSLREKRDILAKKLTTLPPQLKELKSKYKYPVKISKNLSTLTKKTKIQIEKRIKPKIIFLDIDTQYDFLNPKGALYVKGSEKIIKNLFKLTNYAKNTSITIISSQDTHQKDDLEFKNFPPHCIEGGWGHNKIEETLLKKYIILDFKKQYQSLQLYDFIKKYPQIILQKNVLNIFSNPNTTKLLEEIFPDKIYVYGVVTEYCVREAIDGLLKEKFNVGIVVDAIKEISEQRSKDLFSVWRKKGVEFITTDNLISKLKTL